MNESASSSTHPDVLLDHPPVGITQREIQKPKSSGFFVREIGLLGEESGFRREIKPYFTRHPPSSYNRSHPLFTSRTEMSWVVENEGGESWRRRPRHSKESQ